MFGFAKGGGVYLSECGGNEGKKGDAYIFLTVHKGKRGVGAGVILGEKQAYKTVAEAPYYGHTQGGKQHGGIELEAEGVTDAFIVAAAEELRGEYARAGYSAKEHEHIYEYELVDYGYAGQRLGAQAAHHDIIKKIYEV